MAKHLVEVKTLHRYTINELNEIMNNSKSKYSRSLLSAVIMRYNGIHTNDIMKTLCRTRASITTYLMLIVTINNLVFNLDIYNLIQ